jgi:hypothetical protein
MPLEETPCAIGGNKRVKKGEDGQREEKKTDSCHFDLFLPENLQLVGLRWAVAHLSLKSPFSADLF